MTMHIMANRRRRLNRPTAWGMFCLLVCLAFGAACSRSAPIQSAEASTTATGESLPFHPEAANVSNVSEDPNAGSVDSASGRVPFHAHSPGRVLPAGTLLTVQLEKTIWGARIHAGDGFEATLASPITSSAGKLFARGVQVGGRVESVRPGAANAGTQSSGYFELTLNSIAADGRQIPVQTSSLFAKASPMPIRPSSFESSPQLAATDLRLKKGRRLTFRLTAPITIEAPNQ
jgi:hypothetical protein